MPLVSTCIAEGCKDSKYIACLNFDWQRTKYVHFRNKYILYECRFTFLKKMPFINFSTLRSVGAQCMMGFIAGHIA